jgi:hypothetical protein
MSPAAEDAVVNQDFGVLPARSLLGFGLAVALCAGCSSPVVQSPPGAAVQPLGAISDATWATQEQNAEAAKFVVLEHEFKLHEARLNMAGEDHLKQIAASIRQGAKFPIVVERTVTGDNQGKYNYPTGPDPELDVERRKLVVAALERFGVADANDRVFVTPATVDGLNGVAAAAAYQRAILYSRATGSFGGGFGGFGGFGMGGAAGGLGVF